MAEGDEPEVDIEALQQQLASFSVEQFLISAASTIASLAYAKLEREDLPQAKKAIDALSALVPLLEGELAADLGQALTKLQVAYAEAASA
ncbi:MAG: hypothetical protein QOH16_592 [Gaiellaceae bacterium]|jgi:hypothetical protein|nr:hypothetical protein [Gaiellaceae bacterium]